MQKTTQKKILASILAMSTLMYGGIASAAYSANTHTKDFPNNTDNFIYDLKYSNTVENVAGLQIYVGKKAIGDIKVEYLGDIISISCDNENSVRNKYLSGLYSYANREDKKAVTYLGNANSNIDINIKGHDFTSGIWLEGGTDNKDSKIIYKGPEAIINGKNLNITTHSNDYYTYAIHVANRTENTDKDAAKLTINSENTVINATSGAGEGYANGLVVMSEGELYINSNLEVNADNAILTRGNSIIKINEDGKHSTKLNGDIIFDYDDTSSGTSVDADVNINLNGADSYLNGNILVTGENIPEGDEVVTGMELGLSDGATWNTDDDSFVNNLKLDGGIVNMQGNNQKVAIDKVAGDGIITTTDTSNKMTIGEKAANTSLTVKGVGEKLNADALAQDATLAQKLAKTVVTKDNEKQTAADALEAEAGTISGKYTAVIDKNGKITNGTFAVNENNQAVSNMASIALMAWRAENNDINKRLGELRNSTGEHGVWARMMRGESKYGEQNVKNQYNTYQLGYDEKLSTDDHWTVGAAISYTDGQSSFASGSGENKHNGLSLYGSYLGDDGSFVDLIAKYARLKHDFDVNGGIGSGDYDTNGYSVSAEYGKRFTKDNGFWLEPQAELTYGKVGSVSYMTDNGASVRQDGMDSIVGRLGIAAGKNIKNGNVYLRASYLYDFDGETSVTMSKGASTTFEQDLGGGWWEVGVGTNLMLSKATHLYFDVEKNYGGNVATPWQWNAGMRWSF